MHIECEYNRKRKDRDRAQPGLNWWPIGLQPIALPLSYTPFYYQRQNKLFLLYFSLRPNVFFPLFYLASSKGCHVMTLIFNAIIICFCLWRTIWFVVTCMYVGIIICHSKVWQCVWTFWPCKPSGNQSFFIKVYTDF